MIIVHHRTELMLLVAAANSNNKKPIAGSTCGFEIEANQGDDAQSLNVRNDRLRNSDNHYRTSTSLQEHLIKSFDVILLMEMDLYLVS